LFNIVCYMTKSVIKALVGASNALKNADVFLL